MRAYFFLFFGDNFLMRINKFLAAASLLLCLAVGSAANADVVYSVRENDTIEKVAAKYKVTPSRSQSEP